MLTQAILSSSLSGPHSRVPAQGNTPVKWINGRQLKPWNGACVGFGQFSVVIRKNLYYFVYIIDTFNLNVKKGETPWPQDTYPRVGEGRLSANRLPGIAHLIDSEGQGWNRWNSTLQPVLCPHQWAKEKKLCLLEILQIGIKSIHRSSNFLLGIYQFP